MKNRKVSLRRWLVSLLLLALVAALPMAGLATQPTDPPGSPPPHIGVDHPKTPGEVLLFKKAEPLQGQVNTWQVTLRVEAMDTVQTSDTILVIDTSASMNDNGRMGAAISAATTLIEELLPTPTPAVPLNRVAVISFNYYANQAIGFTSNQADAIAAVENLWANGGTFTQDAVYDARTLMASSIADHKNIILLSDGQPTYSTRIQYDWRMNTANLIARTPSGYWTPNNVPQNQFEYGNRVGGGGSIETRYDNPWGTDNDKYYHHGNSAIAEAGFAKANSTLYTIALEAGTTGTSVLNAMASPGKAYTATPSELTAIFTQIAGQINSAVRDATVGDPMGTGFVVNGTVEDIAVTQGTTTYINNQINWTIGTLTQPIAPGSNIKYAQMTYQVTINDDILDAEGSGGLFNTNEGASLTYTYTNDQGQDVTTTTTFPQPKEDPVLLVMEKVLINSLGEVITTSATGVDNRQFNLNVINNFDYNSVC